MFVNKIEAKSPPTLESAPAVRGIDIGGGIQPKVGALLTSGNRIPSMGTNVSAGDNNIKLKEKFKRVFPEISEKVDPKGHILFVLFEKEVITPEEKTIIYNSKDQKSRCLELLHLLENSKHPNAFSVFKEALGRDHQWAVDAIDYEVEDEPPPDKDLRINEKELYSTLTLVPIKSIEIEVRIQGFVANVDCTLCYFNTSEVPMEVVYEFPMDEQSAVYRFEAMIDGRTIVAECQEKKEAKDNYRHALESGLTATLIEEDDSSSDIFRCSLGHLPPNKQAEVRFAYVTELSLEPEGHLSFVLPTVLNPRYNPSVRDGGRVNPPDISYVPKSLPQPYTILFNVVIADAERVTSVTSHKDELNVIFDDTRNEVKVSLAKPFVADHDLSFDVTYRDACQPKVIIEKGRPSKGVSPSKKSIVRWFRKSAKINSATDDGFLAKDIVMLNFFPDFNHLNNITTNHEFIFLIDRSGSMAGRRIREAKEGLLLFLNHLPLECYFNIIGYGSNFQVLFSDGSRQSCELTLNQAREYVDDMAADLGGTEILAPLRFVFNKAGIISHNRQVILLTDGDVTNSQAVIELIANNASNTRVFSIGIGEGASTSLVKGVARAGRGKAAFVKDKEHMQPVILNMLESAKQPGVTDIRVEWKSDRSEDLAPVIVPHRIPPLYAGDRLILFAVFPGQTGIKATVTLGGNIGTEVIEFALPVDFTEAVPSADESFLLHRLAAKAEIKQLQTEEKVISSTGNSEEKSSIVSLSIDANIVSRHTSMVAIDRQLDEVVKEVNVFENRHAVKCKVPLILDQEARANPPSEQHHSRSSNSDIPNVSVLKSNHIKKLEKNAAESSGEDKFCRSFSNRPRPPSNFSTIRKTSSIGKSNAYESSAGEDNICQNYLSLSLPVPNIKCSTEHRSSSTTGNSIRRNARPSMMGSNTETSWRLRESGLEVSNDLKSTASSSSLGNYGSNGSISNVSLIENLQLTREQSKEVVSGICAIGDTIHVVCRVSSKVFGYQVVGGGSDPEVIEVDGMQLPSDMSSSESNQALFISDTNSDDGCIWKIQFPGKDVSKWSVGGAPRGLSMTFSNELMVIVQSETEGRLEFYSSSCSECLKKMSLPEEFEDVWHAVETTKGTYVIAYTENKYNKSGVDVDFFNYRDTSKYSLTELSSDGTTIRSFNVNPYLKLYHLSIDKSDIVFVADEKGVLRLDLDQKEQTRLTPYESTRAPVRLCRQLPQQRLIVGWFKKLSSVSIFNIDFRNKSEQSQASSADT